MERLLELFDVITHNFTRFIDFSMGVMFGIGLYLFMDRVHMIDALAEKYKPTPEISEVVTAGRAR